MRSFLITFVIAIAIIIGWIYGIHIGVAEEYDAQAVRAIVGEASNQGYKCMTYVAHAIRNRGTLKGVHGVYARHNDNESAYTWEMAQTAWDESKIEKDPTHGSNSFGTEDEVPVGTFYVDICRDLYFYKTKQPRRNK